MGVGLREEVGMTQEQFNRLPKWAQDKITTLEWQREQAVTALNGAVNGDKKTDVWYDQHPSTGEAPGPVQKRFYIPDNTVNFRFFKDGSKDETWRGNGVSVSLRQHDNEPNVSITFDSQRVAMIPGAGNVIRFVPRVPALKRGK